MSFSGCYIVMLLVLNNQFLNWFQNINYKKREKEIIKPELTCGSRLNHCKKIKK